MPPRLNLLSRAPTQSLTPFLYPRRFASILTSLSDNPPAYNKPIRRGRGPSSGKGKTSGRGHKGQGQHGKVPAGFNGGQTPEEIVAGKRGFENIWSAELSPVNVNRIQEWVDKGRFKEGDVVTVRELVKSRCIHGVRKDGVKLLARGAEALTTPVHLIVSRASAAAIRAVEKAGGSVTTRYYSPFAIDKIKRGEMDPVHSFSSRITLPGQGEPPSPEELVLGKNGFKYRLPDPTGRKDLEYYRDEAKRGYLSYMVEEGQGPSLFFKTPMSHTKRKKVKSVKGVAGGANNRLW